MSAAGRRDWVEIGATVLLAFAAVATTWSSYQATRWNGEQAKASGRTNAIRIDASRAQGLAEGMLGRFGEIADGWAVVQVEPADGLAAGQVGG